MAIEAAPSRPGYFVNTGSSVQQEAVLFRFGPRQEELRRLMAVYTDLSPDVNAKWGNPRDYYSTNAAEESAYPMNSPVHRSDYCYPVDSNARQFIERHQLSNHFEKACVWLFDYIEGIERIEAEAWIDPEGGEATELALNIYAGGNFSKTLEGRSRFMRDHGLQLQQDTGHLLSFTAWPA